MDPWRPADDVWPPPPPPSHGPPASPPPVPPGPPPWATPPLSPQPPPWAAPPPTTDPPAGIWAAAAAPPPTRSRRRWTRLELLLAALAAMAVIGAAVLVGDRARRESDRQASAQASELSRLTQQFDPLDSSDFETWIGYKTRAGMTNITWRMPETRLIDGPREMLNIPPPAIVTIWNQGGTDLPIRHDATFMHDLNALGPSNEIIGHRALDDLNADSAIIIKDLPTDADGRAEFDYSEVLDTRVYVGHAWSWDGFLFAISAAYFKKQPNPSATQDARNAAYRDLKLLVDSVKFTPV